MLRPTDSRSQSGALLLWVGGVISYYSGRQPFITTCTTESELRAMSESALLSKSIHPLLQELVGAVQRISYCDNVASLAIILQPSGP